MPKLILTKEQYDRLILNEQQSRLKASGDLIIETIDPSVELLEEGWKEVVLGVAMMLGVGLTGQNKIIAQDAVKNAHTMAQIKATLEDGTKTAELVKLLKEKGMKDPETKLADNAEKVMDTYNKIAADDNIKYKVDIKVVNNLQQLKGKLGQGYAVKGVEMSTDTVHGQQTATPVTVTDRIDINLGSDNLFVTGGFTLSQGGTDTIKIVIDAIKKQGGKVERVEIESSTDTEPVAKFRNADDPTGNIKLANLRTQSVTNLLHTLGVDSNITHREIPNNGAELISAQEFMKVVNDKQAITTLREKTTEYRYVKLKIVAVFEKISTKETSTDTIISKYRFELVKIIAATGKAHGINTTTHFKHKQFRCNKKNKLKNIVNACTTF